MRSKMMVKGPDIDAMPWVLRTHPFPVMNNGQIPKPLSPHRNIGECCKPFPHSVLRRESYGRKGRLSIQSKLNLFHKNSSNLSALFSITILGNVVAGFQNGCHRKKQGFSVLNLLLQLIINGYMLYIHMGHVQNFDKHRGVKQTDAHASVSLLSRSSQESAACLRSSSDVVSFRNFSSLLLVISCPREPCAINSGKRFMSAMRTMRLYTMNCPECGTALTPDDVWLKKGSNSWYTLSQCPHCAGSGNAVSGGVFQRYKLARRDGLHWSFARCLQLPDEALLARWNKQRAAQLERLKNRAEKSAEN